MVSNRTEKLIWASCLNYLKNKISQNDFDNWIKPISFVSFSNNVLTIKLPSDIFYDHIEEYFVDYIVDFLEKEVKNEVIIKYQILNTTSNQNKKKEITAKKVNSNLNYDYTFDGYYISDFNKLAGAIGMAISDSPGKTAYNPVLIYGESGMGKTHLVNAIGIRTEKMHPDKKVLYVSSEIFMQQYGASCGAGKLNDFINFYQNLDVLIIDDVQFFEKSEKVQNVFFTIFNHLHQLGKQIIFTSDKLPSEIPNIQERLNSRLQSGVLAEIKKPNLEDKSIILKAKLSKDSIQIDDDVVDFITNNLNTNIREIEGSVISLLAHSSLLKTEITIDLAKSILKNYVKENKKEITIELIKKMVCDYYHISDDKLSSATRERRIVLARQISMHLSKKYTGKSLAYIGKNIGSRDYSTVVYACKTLENLISTDKILKSEYDAIEAKLL